MPEEGVRLDLRSFSEVLSLRNLQNRPYVLIGGQAVNFWAEHYLPRENALKAYAPFASRDIDYLGGKDDVAHIARQLKRKPIYPYWRAMTALAGTVPIKLQAADSAIEVVRQIPGVGSDIVEQSALPASFLDCELRVIFPVHLLISKARMVRTIDQKDRQDLFHLRIMLLCVRTFLKDSLNGVKAGSIGVRDWLDTVKDLLAFTESDLGQNVARQFRIDWTEVLPTISPEDAPKASIRAFYDKRVPLWQDKVRRNFKPGSV